MKWQARVTIKKIDQIEKYEIITNDLFELLTMLEDNLVEQATLEIWIGRKYD